jgi:hypothetical protein
VEFWLHLGTVVACIVAAGFARQDDRKAALPCAFAFALGWVLYRASWLEYAPVRLIYLGTGQEVQPEKLWAATDVIIAVYILTMAWNRYWGISLFLLFFTQLLCHYVRAQGYLADPAYLSALNTTFFLEAICFLAVGGSRVRDHLDHYHDRHRRRLALSGHSHSRGSPEGTEEP